MIRPLRRRHRLLVGSLALLLPPAFLAGIAGRPDPTRVASLPAALLGRPDTPRGLLWSRADFWPGHSIRTELHRVGDAPTLSLDIQEAPRPDTLAYWVAGAPTPHERLPAGAILLGGVDRSTDLPVPSVALRRPGHLLLYSLADREIVATSALLTVATH